MTSNPYAVPALVVVLAVLFGCGSWACLAITRQPGTGKHARRTAPTAEAAGFAAYLHGDPEPPEEAPVPAAPYDPVDDIWWDVKPPPAPVLAVRQPRPVPGAPRARGSAGPLLVRVRDALLPDAWRPEPATATFTPAGADETRTDLPAIRDVQQYLAAPQ